MPVNLSIKNVPDALARKLRKRAAEHHRSLQGELLAILDHCINQEAALTPRQILERVLASGLATPKESARHVREDRDARSRR